MGNKLNRQDFAFHKESTLVQPRVCFISLSNLFFEWNAIPMHILNDSLIILDCRRSFFIHHCCQRNSEIEMKTKSESEAMILDLNIASDKAFIALILAKEDQGHLLWVGSDESVDAYASSSALGSDIMSVSDWQSTISPSEMPKTIIDPKWDLISEWLQTHTDPLTDLNYTPALLSLDWWNGKFAQEIVLRYEASLVSSKQRYFSAFARIEYCDNVEMICDEIQLLEFNFKPTLEILKQSNPTMIPMAKWNPNLFEDKCKLSNHLFGINDIAKGKPKLTQAQPTTQIGSIDSDGANTEFAAINERCLNKCVAIGIADDDGFVYLY